YQRIIELKGFIENLEKEIEVWDMDIKKCLEDISTKDTNIVNMEDKIQNIIFEEDMSKEKLLEVLKNLENFKALEKQVYKNFEDFKNSIFNTEKNKISLMNKQETLDLKSDEIHDYIWNKYDITYIDAKEFEFVEEKIKDKDLSKNLKILKAKIDELGPIDVTSIEDYINVKSRYDFNFTQRNDILKAEEDILKLIDDLTTEMEEKFNSQFEIIRENFSYVFKEMFGGGEAQLILTDKENVLESNIEIKAQPPGKKLNHMSLLSGGEKALTAISLLFAILRMKPTPFCILDEVESALDEANVIKYGEYLHNFTTHTQFIAITHRNGTMESSDTMYGVTMQEKGVSTLVSVEFS
ncbi:MAG: chromosome segregation protein SMC, partial [Lachnospirales bacterium]